jgi:hypothetical protein
MCSLCYHFMVSVPKKNPSHDDKSVPCVSVNHFASPKALHDLFSLLVFGGKIDWMRREKKSSKESSWFREPRCKQGSKAHSHSRIQFVWNESKLVPRNLDPGPHHQLCPTSGNKAFNFTAMDFSIYILEIGLNFNQIHLSFSLAQSHLGYIQQECFPLKLNLNLKLWLIIRNCITYKLYHFY